MYMCTYAHRCMYVLYIRTYIRIYIHIKYMYVHHPAMVCVHCVMHTTGKRKQPQPKMVTDEEMEKPTTKKKTSEGLCVHTYETHVYTSFFCLV